ncbi:MAG: hypothetical protein HYY24_08310 [Verrucomicrobia bacterium]|nr:hypothetical protein [Verrucomicrobiota bacterium]
MLEIQPVFLRKENRTRGPALVSLLALKLARELEQRVVPLGLTVADAVERLKQVNVVCLGEPQLGLWRLAEATRRRRPKGWECWPSCRRRCCR